VKALYQIIRESTGPSFHCEEWDSISDQAKDICTNLVQRHPEIRLDAHEALQHPWMQSIELEYSCSACDTASEKEIESLSPCLIKAYSPSKTHRETQLLLSEGYDGDTAMTTKLET
jgi:serine/threonine protein kinase